jgi:hypothetical protein
MVYKIKTCIEDKLSLYSTTTSSLASTRFLMTEGRMGLDVILNMAQTAKKPKLKN